MAPVCGACVIGISNLTRQTETPHTHSLLQALAHPLTTTTIMHHGNIKKGFEAKVFMHRMPVLLPNPLQRR